MRDDQEINITFVGLVEAQLCLYDYTWDDYHMNQVQERVGEGGNHYRRSLHTPFERWNYLRDRRIDEDTDPYRVHGLENIPDEGGDIELKEEQKQQKEEEEEKKPREEEKEKSKRQSEGNREVDNEVSRGDQEKSVIDKHPKDSTTFPADDKAVDGKTELNEGTTTASSSEDASEPCRRTPKERDLTKEYRLEDDDPCRE